MDEEKTGEQMVDFLTKRAEYRDLAALKTKIRSLPVRVLNRRYKKLQEVG